MNNERIVQHNNMVQRREYLKNEESFAACFVCQPEYVRYCDKMKNFELSCLQTSLT